MHTVLSLVRRRGQFDLAYLDLAKAFDMVHHILLVLKLKHYGMCESFTSWFASYLEDRVCSVRVSGVIGESRYVVRRGVPQGSVLGPLLFKIYLNDLAYCLIDVLQKYFADDSKIGHSICSVGDCETLQVALYNVDKWVRVNGMRINAEMSVVMSFSRKTNVVVFPYKIGGVRVPREEIQRDLGVVFDVGLRFPDHVCRLVGECNRYLGILFRLTFVFKSWIPLRSLYIALVRSRLQYGSLVWSGCSEYLLEKLEGIQRRFVYSLHQRFFRRLKYDYYEMLRRLDLMPVRFLLIYRDVAFLHSLIHGHVESLLLLRELQFRVPAATRQKSVFYVPTDFGATLRMCEQCNSLPADIDIFAMVSSGAFKRQLRHYLCN